MTEVATFETPGGTASIDMRGSRETIYAYLYGRQAELLTAEDRFEVYAQADGFGDCREGDRREWLREYADGGMDWSHVRDSSPEAMARVLSEIVARQGRRS